MNKNLKLFIAFSVILNILLIGIGIGFAMRSPWLLGHRPPPPPPHEELAKLSAEKRELFESALKRTRKEGDAIRKEIREARERMQDILTDDVFDENAYQAESDKIAALYDQQRAKMNATVKTLAINATQEEREVLAKITRRPPPPPHGGPRGDGPPPPPPGDGPPPPPPGDEPR